MEGLGTAHSLDNEDRQYSYAEDNLIVNPVFKLTWVWMLILQYSFRSNEESWNELPENYRSLFNDILAGKEEPNAYARSGLASQFSFLSHLDEKWVHGNLYPLFDWSIPEKTRDVWSGYLYAPGLDIPTLTLLWPRFQIAFPHFNTMLQPMAKRFVELTAYIALFMTGSPLKDNWILDFIMYCSTDQRVDFASKISRHLRKMDEEKAIGLWSDWLEEYWDYRIKGKPASLEAPEVDEMLHWVTSLTPVFPQVVNKISESGTLLSNANDWRSIDLLDQLSDDYIMNQYADFSSSIIALFTKN
jgi:hypothetical protein